MNKYEFLAKLSRELDGLPKEEIKERINFYSEMIDDAVFEGLTEEEAVARICDTDAERKEAVPERSQKRRLGAWEIVLLAFGSPLWISLAIAAFAVLLSLYACVWAVVISLWSVFACFIGCSLGVLICAIAEAFGGRLIASAALVGAALVLAGLSIFAFFGCKAITKGVVILTKKIFKRRKAR